MTAFCGSATANEAARLVEEIKKHIAESSTTLECDVKIERHYFVKDRTKSSWLNTISEKEQGQKLVLFVKDNGNSLDIGTTNLIKNCPKSLSIMCNSENDYPALKQETVLILENITGKIFYQEDNHHKSDKVTKTVDDKTYRLFSDVTNYAGYCRKRDFKMLF